MLLQLEVMQQLGTGLTVTHLLQVLEQPLPLLTVTE
jgi:hypothetical protein